MKNFYNHLVEVLSQEKSFVSTDGHLLKNKIYESAMHGDVKLLKLLINDLDTKRHFFTDIEGICVFDKIQFGWIINNSSFLPDSYTRFKNKVGLTDKNSDFLSQKNSVELVWPYKDCILEGGQTKEDQKKKEVFYNENLTPDEIDRLLYPKVLCNALMIDENGDTPTTQITDDDNLIIKGNNLLALTSILQRYQKKARLIYIDPPYNTGSDSFGYNDNFTRSSWLTFMKNRITEAKKLMRSDGLLCVQCSFHQYPYLKVLLDEIMTEKCYKTTFHILVRHPERILTGDKEFNDVIEYILVYSKVPEYKLPKKGEEKTVDDYVYQVNILSEGSEIEIDSKKINVYLPHEYEVIKTSPNEKNFKTLSVRGSIREKNSSGRYYVKNLEGLKDSYPPLTLFKVPNIGDDIYDFRYFYLPKLGNKNGGYYQGKPTSSDTTYIPYPNFFNFEPQYNIVNDEGVVSFRNGKKPEALLKFLIEAFTNDQDLVIDFFLGSGTTCAVAHKLGRQYIGIEQLDYLDNDSLTRLKAVIQGEGSGISNEVNWQGGGSFVCCELKSLNQNYIDKIQCSSSSEELVCIWNDMKENSFISSKVFPSDIDSNITEFKNLSIEDQQRILMQLLDKNMLYVNLCDIDDTEFAISEDDKLFNDSFYRR